MQVCSFCFFALLNMEFVLFVVANIPEITCAPETVGTDGKRHKLKPFEPFVFHKLDELLDCLLAITLSLIFLDDMEFMDSDTTIFIPCENRIANHSAIKFHKEDIALFGDIFRIVRLGFEHSFRSRKRLTLNFRILEILIHCFKLIIVSLVYSCFPKF